MNNPISHSAGAMSRRAVVGAGGAAGLSMLLAACSGGSGSSSSDAELKFWNMPLGPQSFLTEDQRIVAGYKKRRVAYRQVQWSAFVQTFGTAVAANTGPAVSGGGGTQAFQFASQGKIAYADNLLDSWKKNGIYDDFLPGLVDTLKTDNGYAAVPYNLDFRVLWYNKAILEQAGADVPTSWDTFEATCRALKRRGVYGYGSYSGAGGFAGAQSLVGHMINNGGGLYGEDQKPNCVTPENIEAMDWVLGLVKSGYVDPRAASYTADNAYAQMNAGKFGMIWDTSGTAAQVNATTRPNLVVADPLTGPSGKKGSLFFPNNLMMYKNTPSQAASEDFLTYYFQNMKTLWTKKTGIGLPVLKSIVDTAYSDDPNSQKIIKAWQPIAKTFGAPGQNTVFEDVAKVDGTQPMTNFAQSILSGNVTARAALTTLQTALQS